VDAAPLAGLPLLEGAAADQLNQIAAHMSLEAVPAGTILGREGDPGDKFWLLIDGRVSVTTIRRHLADAGPGSILGELAVLRGAPRTATITAVTECCFATGGRDALEKLLDVGAVRNRVRRLASARLAADLRPVHATLKDGQGIIIRPLLPADRKALDEALSGLSIDTIRRRFFSVSRPTEALVDYLVDIDYVDHFAWVVLANKTFTGLAAARYVRTTRTEAEVAFTIVDEYQRRGLGTFLLGALGVAATEAGIATLVAHVMEDNMPMRAVFAKAEAKSSFDEPGLVFVRMQSTRAAELLEPAIRQEIGSAVHDVVTAASLALQA
jgi:CRP-like cAMP-binding protein